MPDQMMMANECTNNLISSALMVTAEQQVKDSKIKQQAYPIYYKTRDIIYDQELSGNNSSTLMAWVWRLMRADYALNKTLIAQQLPVNFGYYGAPGYALLAVHNMRFKAAEAKVHALIRSIKATAEAPANDDNHEELMRKVSELIPRVQDLIKESKDYRMATYIHSGMQLVLTPTQEMHQKIEAVCTQSMQQNISLMETFKSNIWETIQKLETMNRLERIENSKKSRKHQHIMHHQQEEQEEVKE